MARVPGTTFAHIALSSLPGVNLQAFIEAFESGFGNNFEQHRSGNHSWFHNVGSHETQYNA